MASAIRDWLPRVLQGVKPFMSEEDIEKGARSLNALSDELAGTMVGIICLTPESQSASWLNFEAGAISKIVERSKVCPVLLDMRNADLRGPLASFQTTECERPDFLRLLKSINAARGEAQIGEDILEDSFDRWWPDLRDRLAAIPAQAKSPTPERGYREILQEVLESVRLIVRDNSRLEGVLRGMTKSVESIQPPDSTTRLDAHSQVRLTARLSEDLQEQAARITDRLEELRDELSQSPNDYGLKARITNLRRLQRELNDFAGAIFPEETELIG